MRKLKGVSIIIPVYNAEKFIAKCIKSILRQTHDKFELILVNDGSTDKSLMICNQFADKDKRIKILNKENEGSIKARQMGVKNSTYELITFVDADDWIDKDMIQIIVREAERTQSDVVVFNMIKALGKRGFIRRTNKSRYFDNSRVYEDDEIKEKLVVAYLYGHPFPGNLCGKLYKRKCVEESGKYLKEIKFLGDDLYYNLEIFLKVKKVSVINENLYYYRAGGNTSKYMPFLFNDMVNGYKIQKEVINEFFQHDIESNMKGISIMLLNTFKTELYNLFFSNMTRIEIENRIKEYLDNNEINEAMRNKGSKNYFENEFMHALKNKNIDFLYNMGEQSYKKVKIRRRITSIVNKI